MNGRPRYLRHWLDHGVRATWGPALFSLAETDVVEAILQKSGFAEVAFSDVHEPVYYGPDVDTAYHIICSFRNTKDFLARLDAGAAERALDRLRRMLTDHLTGNGVLFDSRAWIVTARVVWYRGPAGWRLRQPALLRSLLSRHDHRVSNDLPLSSSGSRKWLKVHSATRWPCVRPSRSAKRK